MRQAISLNGTLFEEVDISPRSSSALYGKGIFTTIAIYDRKPFLWEKHWRRLTNNTEKIGIDLSEHSEEATRKALDEIIEKNNVTDGRARITFFDESPSGVWSLDTNGKTSLSIITGDLRPKPANFRLTVSSYPVNSRSPLAGVKSCNYLENILAFENAKESGFDEAVRLNERGLITSACMANVFWLKDGHLYTPNLASGCLAGTTRAFLLENIECDEVEEGIDAINEADAIFLTSAGLGVTQVAEYASRNFDKSDHPVLGLLPDRR